jgi:tight adherence protein C
MITSEHVMAALVAALMGGAIAFGILVLLINRANRGMLERLQSTISATNPHSPVDVTSDVSGVLGILVRVARLLRPVKPLNRLMQRMLSRTRRRQLHDKLEAAGMREWLTPDDLAEAQMIGAVGSFVLLVLIAGAAPKMLLLAGLVAALMYRLTLVPVTNLVQNRQERIRGCLPKCADILVVAVEAGMTLDRALQLYVERFANPLADELRRIQEDMKIGVRRRDAFQSAMDRVNLDDLTRFLSAVMLAERFGVPVAMVLRDQSEALKQQRVMRIREASMKAPIKMLVPTVALILPALLIILIGPLIVIMLHGGLF